RVLAHADAQRVEHRVPVGPLARLRLALDVQDFRIADRHGFSPKRPGALAQALPDLQDGWSHCRWVTDRLEAPLDHSKAGQGARDLTSSTEFQWPRNQRRPPPPRRKRARSPETSCSTPI